MESTSRIATGVSTMAHSFVCSGAPAASIAATSWCTSSALLTLGTTIAAGPALLAAAMSASCHSVPIPLTRIVTVRRPYSPLAAAAHAAFRADSFASGATASSRSRIRPSHAIDLAFSSARSLELGM